MQTLSQQSTLGGTDTVTSDGRETVRNSEKTGSSPNLSVYTERERGKTGTFFSDYVNISFPPQIIFWTPPRIYFSLIIEKKKKKKKMVKKKANKQ